MRAISLAIAAALVCAACGGSDSGSANKTDAGGKSDATSAVQIEGDAADPVNKIVVKAIADLEKYWAEEFPKLYGGEYKPVAGGLFAVEPSSGKLPPCAESPADIAGNAFYCSTKDVVAWDVEGLLPDLRKRFGDFVVPVVMAHEWGHVIQARAAFEGLTVTREIQADCFAGAWSKHALDAGVFDANSEEQDAALAGFLFLRDEPGTARNDPSAHGSGFDRVNSYRTGYEQGPDACKGYRDGEPVIVEVPFNSAEDLESGGNAPYKDIVAGVPADLEDYWTRLYPELAQGKAWTPVKSVRPFDPSKPPSCGGAPVDDFVLFYCVDDDYVGFDNVDTMPQFYDQGGDFAVAALLATQWGIAAEVRAGDDPDSKEASLRADCFAGGWTASVLLGNRESSNYRISPGDLDEAIAALLLFPRAEGSVERQGTGSERVDAFRKGVFTGAESCVT